MSSALLPIARRIAIDAGELAARRRAEGVSVAATKSTAVDVVTEADRETERFIREALAEARPDDGILGEEEGGGTAGSSGLHWIVDPIDGTVNFLYGIPHYAVSIAVVEGDPDPLTWRGLAGCVVNPATGEVYAAAVGEGAFRGDAPIRVADAVELSHALVGTGFAYDADMRAWQGEVITRMLPRIRDIRRQGTASLDLCFVADGRYNAYFERTLSPWDHAAGAIIAREAGATVKGVGEEAPDRRLVLAAQPTVARELEALMAESGFFA